MRALLLAVALLTLACGQPSAPAQPSKQLGEFVVIRPMSDANGRLVYLARHVSGRCFIRWDGSHGEIGYTQVDREMCSE